MSGRVRIGLALGAGLLIACGPPKPRQLSVAQLEALRARLEAQGGVSPAASPAPAATPGPAAKQALPPRDDAERRKRAQAALAPGADLGEAAPVGDGTRWLVAFARTPGGGGRHLLLLDVAQPKGVVLGEHDFGGERASGVDPERTRIGRTFLLDATPGEQVVLAEILQRGEDGAVTAGACGWALGRRSLFVCAPRMTPTSRYEQHDGQLVESWQVDTVGARAARSGAMRNGRVLRWANGSWSETDAFRCLGRPLADAFRDAGVQPLGRWQEESVRRLLQAAKRQSAALETDAAIALLRDAIAIDGCSSDAWRVLGRLELEAGRPEAVTSLAVALALAPRDGAALLDLGDALAVLDPARPEARELWHDALAVLERRGATRRFVEGPGGKSPQALAAVLYEEFLARTSPSDEWLAARRRRVEEKLDALEGGPRARP